jgi:hypothetical protein
VHAASGGPRRALVVAEPEVKLHPAGDAGVLQAHDATAGVYSAVLVEGTLRKGDAVELLD